MVACDKPGRSAGPLAGTRVIELAGLGPAPHAALLLADLGADVVRVQRPGQLKEDGPETVDATMRNRRVVEADLKSAEDKENVLDLIDRADILLEGFRPGVAERLGLGPDLVRRRNPRLVYGRITGWGQTGPLAYTAGHDINYIALSGVLHAIGHPDQPPVLPLNLIGDYGGGSMFLLFGVLAALIERQRSGHGQVVDAAMVEGALALTHQMWAQRGTGEWSDGRGVNLADGSCPFYTTYETSDGKYVAVGPLEPKFYDEMLSLLELDPGVLPDQYDRAGWPTLHKIFMAKFAERTRDEWDDLFTGTDACVSGVLTFAESANNSHLISRQSLVEIDNVVQHGPTPRFSRSVPEVPYAPAKKSSDIRFIWQS